jgi:hypothetical protein
MVSAQLSSRVNARMTDFGDPSCTSSSRASLSAFTSSIFPTSLFLRAGHTHTNCIPGTLHLLALVHPRLYCKTLSCSLVDNNSRMRPKARRLVHTSSKAVQSPQIGINTLASTIGQSRQKEGKPISLFSSSLPLLQPPHYSHSSVGPIKIRKPRKCSCATTTTTKPARPSGISF